MKGFAAEVKAAATTIKNVVSKSMVPVCLTFGAQMLIFFFKSMLMAEQRFSLSATHFTSCVEFVG